ncbi:MAG: histidine kinase [Demequinaceae bacterium]|nr:histidine kinase [Demequinaceae bacterium]
MSTDSVERIARPLERRRRASTWPSFVLGAAMITAALAVAAHRYHWDFIGPWVVPSIAFITGLALVWSPLDAASSREARRPDLVVGMFSRENGLRVAVGLVLAAFTMVWFSKWQFTDQPVLRAVIVWPGILLGAALIFAPWWIRLIRQVSVERLERVREFERAEIAAHLHDSVLQTLTLIRKSADDPKAVATLARAQERDLRSYLYQGRRNEAQSVATALGAAIAQVEDAQGVAIEVVSVGDAPTNKRLKASVAAAKEAASNAARHGIEPISVYAELTATRYEVFIRDSGPGFNPKRVPAGRLGIRESIVGRVARHGGSATVTSKVGIPTEVHLSMPLRKDGGEEDT